MAITPVNTTNAPYNATPPNQAAFDDAVNNAQADNGNAQLQGQLVEGAISAFAPTLLMQRAGQILREAQSDD